MPLSTMIAEPRGVGKLCGKTDEHSASNVIPNGQTTQTPMQASGQLIDFEQTRNIDHAQVE